MPVDTSVSHHQVTHRIGVIGFRFQRGNGAHTVMGFIGDRFRSSVAGCNVCSAKMAVYKCLAEEQVYRFCLSKTLHENEHD